MRNQAYRLISKTLSTFPKSTSPNSQVQNPLKTLNHIRNFSAPAQESKPPPSNNVLGIVDEISGLTLYEMSDFVEVLRNKMGIKEMPSMAVMMPGMEFSPGMGSGAKAKGAGAAGQEDAKKKEKTAFDLKLEGGFDAGSKIKIIKEVRACTDLGLKEAKELVEKAPTLLKKGVTKDEADKIIEKLKAVGANVTMD